MFDGYARLFASADFNGCAFIRAVAEYPDSDSPVHQTVVRHKQALIDTLRELISALEISSARALSRQVFMLLEGAIVNAHTFGDRAAASDAREAALALIASARGK